MARKTKAEKEAEAAAAEKPEPQSIDDAGGAKPEPDDVGSDIGVDESPGPLYGNANGTLVRSDDGGITWNETTRSAEVTKPRKGDLTVLIFGQEWGPIACGEHNSHPVVETSTDDEPEAPAGFDPRCEACKAQLEAATDSAYRNVSA